MTNKKPTYLTIADARSGNDRICFYFGLNEHGKTVFASKRLLNGSTESKKGDLNEILGWVGFTSNLSHLLYSDEKFKKKYNLNITDVVKDQLKHVCINDNSVVFFMNTETGWIEIEAIDIKNNFGTQIEEKINNLFGQSYLVNLESAQELFKKEQSKLDENIEKTKIELAEIEKKSLQEKNKQKSEDDKS